MVLLISFLVFAFSSAHAKPEHGIDFILAIDNSGSMKKNDPLKMRIQAAKMFITLLSEKDRVSLVNFSDKTYKMTPFLSLANYSNELKIYDQIDRLTATGLRTNIYAALRHGYETFRQLNSAQAKNSPRRDKIIILMSDGKMDVGNNNLDLRLLERTLEDLTPRLAEEKIRVYSIAFTKTSYIPLLRLAAQDTNGSFTLVKNANAVHQVFENIFERSKSPNMLPITENSFIVDKNVNELTIVASKLRPNTTISLENPSGQDFNKKTIKPNIRWFYARKFDLITITKPTSGFWRLKFSEGENKAYIVTDLSLNSIVSKTTAEPGKPFLIQAWLQKNKKRLTKKAILNNTQFVLRIIYPDESVQDFPLVDDGSEVGSERKDGIYGNTLTLYDEGIYKLEVIITGETFDRKKASFVSIKSLTESNPFAQQAMPVTEPFKEPEPIKKVIEPSLPIEPINTHEPENEPEIIEDQTHSNIDQEKHPSDEISAESITHSSEEDASSVNYTQAIIGFLLLNIALGLGYGAYVYYNKRFSKSNTDNSDKPAEDVQQGFADEGVDLDETSTDKPIEESAEIFSEESREEPAENK